MTTEITTTVETDEEGEPMTEQEAAEFLAKVDEEFDAETVMTEEEIAAILDPTTDMSDEEFAAYIAGIEAELGTTEKEKMFTRR